MGAEEEAVGTGGAKGEVGTGIPVSSSVFSSFSLNVKAAAFTKTAKEKIEAAGGNCELSTEIYINSFVASGTRKSQTSPKPTEKSTLKKDESIQNKSYNVDGGGYSVIKFAMSINTTPVNKGYRSFFYNKNLDDFILNNEQSEDIKFSIEDEFLSEDNSSENVAHAYLKAIFNNIYSKLFSSNDIVAEKCNFHHVKTVNLPLKKKSIVKFNQYCFDIPVYASTSSVTLDKHNNLISIQSNVGHPDEKLDLEPKYNYQEIVNIFESNSEFRIISQDEDRKVDNANLHIYFNSKEERWCLVYIIQNAIKKANNQEEDNIAPEIADLVVDSEKGKIIDILHRTQ